MTTRTWTDTLADHVWGDTPGGANANWNLAFTPSLTDDAIIDGTSPGDVQTNGLHAECHGLDCTGFVHTLTVNSALKLYGNVILGSGMTIAGSDQLQFVGTAQSLQSNGIIIPLQVTINGGMTFTLLDDERLLDRPFTLNSDPGNTIVFNGHALRITVTGTNETGLYCDSGAIFDYSASGSKIIGSGPAGSYVDVNAGGSVPTFPPVDVSGGTQLYAPDGTTFQSIYSNGAGAYFDDDSTWNVIGDCTFIDGEISQSYGTPSMAGSELVVGGDFVSDGCDLVNGILTISGTGTISNTTVTDMVANKDITCTNCVDGGGNDAHFLFASSGPSVPVITDITTDTGTSASDGITSDQTLVISGTSDATSTIEVFQDAVSIGTTAAVAGAWSFDYTGTILAPGTYEFTATATDGMDTSDPSDALEVIVDIAGPTASSVTTDHATGTFATGEVIDSVVHFPESIIKTGTPRLAMLMNGGTIQYASYLSGTGTSALTFRFTAAANSVCNAWRPHALDLNGGTLKDTAGNNASLTVPSADASIANIGITHGTSYATNENHRMLGMVR